jgi:NAD(P)H-hydrate repair Nnr-like enzyme with NAD(P)H-hydrate dehydratase domain
LEEVQADRPAAARALAERYRAVVVLKGAGTLVAWPSASRAAGDAGAADVRLVRNPTGNNRLATAGTGDVLAGLIGALLARGLDAPAAAQLGVWVHGQAGEQLSDERPTASGVLPALAGVLSGVLMHGRPR